MAFDYTKESIMLEFNHAARPDVKDVQKKFGLKQDEIDDSFGVIPMSGKNGKESYVVVVTKDAAERVEKSAHPDFLKNWSNPKMEPFEGDSGHGFGFGLF